MFQGAEIRGQRPRWIRSSLSKCEGFKSCRSKWELGAGEMLGKLSGFKSHHGSHGEPVTTSSSSRPALLTPVSLCASICCDLEKISPKSGLNYRLRLTDRHTSPSSPSFHTAPAQSGGAGCQSPQQSGLSLLQPAGPPHIRINAAISFRESAWSRCCADPIISTSDGLPAS